MVGGTGKAGTKQLICNSKVLGKLLGCNISHSEENNERGGV
jgi:hypothetical protein